ncbi:MAG TPA: hypothetical protein EYP86_04375 [Candidatus Altiarchaeales archaeon]|nr:hypothetical protein [Candidatus Altiarchaeales archaeon]
MRKEVDIFDKPENVQKVVYLFFVCLVILVIADFIIHKHPHFLLEGIPVFYPLYGFVSCVSLVFIAKALRKIVERGENYYDQ